MIRREHAAHEVIYFGIRAYVGFNFNQLVSIVNDTSRFNLQIQAAQERTVTPGLYHQRPPLENRPIQPMMGVTAQTEIYVLHL